MDDSNNQIDRGRTVSTPAQIAPLQQVTFKKSDFDDESLTLFNQQMTNVTAQINRLLGFSGPISFANHVSLGGNRLMQVGDAVDPSDAVSSSFGAAQYGPAALQPQLNALGKYIMQTYRQLGNPNQREPSSSFLNQTQSTPPASNTSIVTYGEVSSSTVPVTVSAGLFQRVDGSVSPYASRTDTLALPITVALSSLTRSSNIVTAVTSAANGLIAGDGVSIINVTSDPTFNGSFVVQTVTPPDTFTYFQGGPNGSVSGEGDASYGGLYYYYLAHGQSTLGLASNQGAIDNTSSRIGVSLDGTAIVAVVVLTANGVDTLNTAAGASPQQAGSSVAILRRL
jgi:hypothetical protein